MEIFDLENMKVHPREERGRNVFFSTGGFKARLIHLEPGQKIPECEMRSFVVFLVIRGSARVQVNGESRSIARGNCVVTEPAMVSLLSEEGALIAGFQINAQAD